MRDTWHILWPLQLCLSLVDSKVGFLSVYSGEMAFEELMVPQANLC